MISEIDLSMKTTCQMVNGLWKVIPTKSKLSHPWSETISSFHSLSLLLKCKEMIHFLQWRCLYQSLYWLFWRQLVSFYQVRVISINSPSPKIDTFYENSRNFQNSKIFGEVLSKSPILGQNHKNDGLFSDFDILLASSS